MLPVAAVLLLQTAGLSHARQRLLVEGTPLLLLRALSETDIIRATSDPSWPYLSAGREITLVCFGDATRVQASLRTVVRNGRGWKVRKTSYAAGPVFESGAAWINVSEGHIEQEAPFLFKDILRGDPSGALKQRRRAEEQGLVPLSRFPKNLFDIRIIVKRNPIRI